MVKALLRALGQLDDPTVQKVLGGAFLLAVASFALLWWLVGSWLLSTSLLQIGWLDSAIDALGGVATLLLTWFLFPLLVSSLIGLFLEPVAAAVERRHYPHLGPAAGVPFWTGVWSGVRFLLLVILVNAMLLVLLVVPPAYAVGYYLLNGVLLGREYAELVALRRAPLDEVRALRRAHGLELLAFGVFAAFVATLPIVNLVAPVVLTAMMVHLVAGWRGQDRSGERDPSLPPALP
ncbi:MAG: EI24 domain-containing protein [Planctomycetota bacterium]|jgi:CysZ protein